MAVILSLVFEVIVCGDSFAKSGQKHIQLWDDVFGISDSSSRNNICEVRAETYTALG